VKIAADQKTLNRDLLSVFSLNTIDFWILQS